ncbi:MAG: alkaline phosphatase family protein [Muribaculaceae bacterium]|nr:alkaline phosphatase family protein [Muribaculaceae bacterium]
MRNDRGKTNNTLTRLLSSMIMGLMTINTVTLADSSRPKLVVGIIIDQLRTDYLEYLREYYGDKGFNRLIGNGLYLPDLDFRALVRDPATATALLYTGNYPAINGIPAASLYDHQSGRALPALNDPATIGNFTNATLSPASLRLSTIADELAIDGGGLGLVYAVAADAQQSIVMAGHAGNCALWLDQNTGNWCSTTYYRDFPQNISRRNHKQPLSHRVDTISWRPALPLNRYPGIPGRKLNYPFTYTYPSNDKAVYERFAVSPPGNAEVTDVAIDCIDALSLGHRSDAIDMLNVAYSLAPCRDIKDGDYRLELEDAYIRLDAQIARLLEAIDRKTGLDNTLIFVSSTGYYNDATPDDPKYRIPSGDISLKRIESLLNSFLSAKYGNGDYVEGIHRSQIYLNATLTDRKGLDLKTVRDEAREFVIKMSGIASARTLYDLLSDTSAEAEAVRLTIDPKTSGDILLTFTPGWNVIDDQTYPTTVTPVRESVVLTPAIIYYPVITPRTISETIDATAIAPTVTSILHIRSPNGAQQRPLKY